MRYIHAQIRNRVGFKILIIALVLLVFWGIQKHQKDSISKRSTIEEMLKTALKPVGSTMYIWGGGWDGEDNGSGQGSTQIGLNPKWKSFMKEQDENYDYKEHRLERENG